MGRLGSWEVRSGVGDESGCEHAPGLCVFMVRGMVGVYPDADRTQAIVTRDAPRRDETGPHAWATFVEGEGVLSAKRLQGTSAFISYHPHRTKM